MKYPVNVVTPSMVYSKITKEVVRQILGNKFKIVDFRPLKAGDRFVSDVGCISSTTMDCPNYIRFIVKEIPQIPRAVELDDAWE